MNFETAQEEFWAGEFGDSYIARNQSPELLAANLAFFSKALQSASHVETCLEFGANIGMNLKALKLLYPNMGLYGLEINKTASDELCLNIPPQNVLNESILNFENTKSWDLVLIKGVLIHTSPDHLKKTYQKLYDASNKYILVAEYYNPIPVAVEYRGFNDRLFKRDFAGELLDTYSSLSLIDYGFFYHRDNKFPQDDITWFLLEKGS